jgi:Cu/Ag efflux pump CusA
MLESLIRFSIRQRWTVLLLIVALAAIGVASLLRLPIDADWTSPDSAADFSPIPFMSIADLACLL